MLVLASDAAGVAGITAGATLLAALIVAGITAKTTSNRQRRQLTAESDRQAATLAHDREQADIADLRKLLDDLAIALYEASDAIDTLAIAFKEHGEALPAEVLKDVATAGKEVERLDARMHVRIRKDDPLSLRLKAFRDSVHDGWRAARPLEGESHTKRSEQLQEAREALNDRLIGEFLEAAVAATGAKVGEREK